MLRLDASLSSAALVAVASIVASPPISGQPYPTKPVKIIVAFAPGGGNDFIARFMAQRLTTALGQQFIVENKPGAGGTVGFEAGIKSPPDGYTLTLISNSYTVNPSIYKLRFDPIADMTAVIQISQGPYVVVVHPSVRDQEGDRRLAAGRTRCERESRMNWSGSLQDRLTPNRAPQRTTSPRASARALTHAPQATRH